MESGEDGGQNESCRTVVLVEVRQIITLYSILLNIILLIQVFICLISASFPTRDKSTRDKSKEPRGSPEKVKGSSEKVKETGKGSFSRSTFPPKTPKSPKAPKSSKAPKEKVKERKPKRQQFTDGKGASDSKRQPNRLKTES